MKVLFLVNPMAGRGAARKLWQRLERIIPRTPVMDVVVPADCAATRRYAAQAVKAGVERIVVVGGDGTLAAVAGELALTDTSLGVIPAGTGNDLVRNCGLPRKPEAALAVALGKETRHIDLGLVNGRQYFVNAAGVGFDAEVAAAAGAYPAGLGGTLPYLLGAVRTMAWHKPVEVELSVDDQRFSGPVALVVTANGRFYGGGMKVAPQAHQDDGKLDVCIAGSLGRMEILSLLGQVYTGAHARHPKVRMFRGTHIRLKVPGTTRMHLDGEPGHCEELSLQTQPRALSVAVGHAGR